MSPRLAHDHPVSILFLDETGRVGKDGLFGVGCLRVPDFVEFFRDVRAARMEHHIHSELQWKHVGESGRKAKELDVVRTVLEKVCDRSQATFCAIFDDGSERHLTRRYGGVFDAYEQMATDAIYHLIDEDEVVTVLADRYTPPQYLTFEKTVREAVNERASGLAVASLVRLKSSATDGLQMVDLLLGAIAYDFRKRGQGEGVKQDLTNLVQSFHDVPCYRPTGQGVPGWFNVEYRGRGRGRRSGAGRRAVGESRR